VEIDVLDAQGILDDLHEEHLAFALSLACLERAIESTPADPATRIAQRTLAARFADLEELRDALAELHRVAADRRVHRLFVDGAALSDYLRGIYAWVHAVVRALGELARGVAERQVDWARYRCRIEQAKNFHFDELWEAIRADVRSLPRDDLDDAVASVCAGACILEKRLDQRVS
jgi:hypothetical protein